MKNVFKAMLAMSVVALTLPVQAFAQAPAPAAAAVAAQPSAEEITAAQAINIMPTNNAAEVNARNSEVDKFVLKFPASTLNGFLFTLAGEASQKVQDSNKAKFYYEKAIQADPTSDYAMIMLGAEIANGTKEYDLDKADKLTRATKLANDGLALIEKRTKAPQEPQADFDASKKDDKARAQMTLGLIALAGQKYEEAGTKFLLAVETAQNADASNLLRAGMAFNQGKKWDDANKALDRFIATPGMPDQYKKMAEEEKKRGDTLRKQK
ncbi:MAG: tetratricopeptide repeat protein [Acidobacteriota bacterium]